MIFPRTALIATKAKMMPPARARRMPVSPSRLASERYSPNEARPLNAECIATAARYHGSAENRGPQRRWRAIPYPERLVAEAWRKEDEMERTATRRRETARPPWVKNRIP